MYDVTPKPIRSNGNAQNIPTTSAEEEIVEQSEEQ